MELSKCDFIYKVWMIITSLKMLKCNLTKKKKQTHTLLLMLSIHSLPSSCTTLKSFFMALGYSAVSRHISKWEQLHAHLSEQLPSKVGFICLTWRVMKNSCSIIIEEHSSTKQCIEDLLYAIHFAWQWG